MNLKTKRRLALSFVWSFWMVVLTFLFGIPLVKQMAGMSAEDWKNTLLFIGGVALIIAVFAAMIWLEDHR